MTGLSRYDQYVRSARRRATLQGGPAVWRMLVARIPRVTGLYTDDEVAGDGLDFGKVQGDSG